MLLLLIQIALGVSALYGFGMWIYCFVLARFLNPYAYDKEPYRSQMEQLTFRLGICAIVAAGFLGLLLKGD